MSENESNLTDNDSIQDIANVLTSMANEIDNQEVAQLAEKVPVETPETMLTVENMNKLMSDSIDFMTRVIQESGTTKSLLSSAFQQQAELVKNVSNVMLSGAKEYIGNFKEVANITKDIIKRSALIGASTIYDKVLKAIELKEKASGYVGQSKPVDELIKQHETVIYIMLQKSSLDLLESDNYLSSELSDADIKQLIDKVVDEGNTTEIQAHVIRSAQIFFFNKMGSSVVDTFGDVSTTIEDEGDKMNLNDTIDNADVIGQYKLAQLRKRIVSLVEDRDELKSFLITLVNDTHNNEHHNHSKYFGMTQDVSSFVNDIIGPEGFLSIDTNYRLNSVEQSVDYYIGNILGKKIKKDGSTSSGDSIRSPNGQLYKRVANLEEGIDENLNDITEYVNQQHALGFKDFGDEGDEAEKTEKMNNLTQAVETRKTQLTARVQQLYQKMDNAINNHDNSGDVEELDEEEGDSGKRKRDDVEESDSAKRRKAASSSSSATGGKKTRKRRGKSKRGKKTKKNKKPKKNGKMTKKKSHKSKKSNKKSRRSKRK